MTWLVEDFTGHNRSATIATPQFLDEGIPWPCLPSLGGVLVIRYVLRSSSNLPSHPPSNTWGHKKDRPSALSLSLPVSERSPCSYVYGRPFASLTPTFPVLFYWGPSVQVRGGGRPPPCDHPHPVRHQGWSISFSGISNPKPGMTTYSGVAVSSVTTLFAVNVREVVVTCRRLRDG